MSSSAQECNWQTVKDTEGGYRISFPGEAEYAADDVPTVKGNVVMKSYTYQAEVGSEDKNIVYMTGLTQYPDSFFTGGIIDQNQRQKMLDNATDGILESTDGTLKSEEKITFNGYPGRIAKINVKGDLILEVKIVFVDQRVYVVQAIYFTKEEGNEFAKKFFDSFELINVKP